MASDVETVVGTLARIHLACRARGVSDRLGAAAVSEHQGRILSLLDPDDPVMVTELADAMGVTASTMSLNLTRLEARGLITRERDPADRRVMNVRLSRAGAELSEGFSALDFARVDALLRALEQEDRRAALAALVSLASAADALLGGGRSADRPVPPPADRA